MWHDNTSSKELDDDVARITDTGEAEIPISTYSIDRIRIHSRIVAGGGFRIHDFGRV